MWSEFQVKLSQMRQVKDEFRWERYFVFLIFASLTFQRIFAFVSIIETSVVCICIVGTNFNN